MAQPGETEAGWRMRIPPAGLLLVVRGLLLGWLQAWGADQGAERSAPWWVYLFLVLMSVAMIEPRGGGHDRPQAARLPPGAGRDGPRLDGDPGGRHRRDAQHERRQPGARGRRPGRPRRGGRRAGRAWPDDGAGPGRRPARLDRAHRCGRRVRDRDRAVGRCRGRPGEPRPGGLAVDRRWARPRAPALGPRGRDHPPADRHLRDRLDRHATGERAARSGLRRRRTGGTASCSSSRSSGSSRRPRRSSPRASHSARPRRWRWRVAAAVVGVLIARHRRTASARGSSSRPPGRDRPIRRPTRS